VAPVRGDGVAVVLHVVVLPHVDVVPAWLPRLAQFGVGASQLECRQNTSWGSTPAAPAGAPAVSLSYVPDIARTPCSALPFISESGSWFFLIGPRSSSKGRGPHTTTAVSTRTTAVGLASDAFDGQSEADQRRANVLPSMGTHPLPLVELMALPLKEQNLSVQLDTGSIFAELWK
jgi:hypothetical protein